MNNRHQRMVIPEKEETDKVSTMIPSAQSLQRDSRWMVMVIYSGTLATWASQMFCHREKELW